MVLKPLIGLREGSVMGIVAGIGNNVGEVREGAVGDVLRKIRIKRNKIETLVAVDHIAKISERIVALQIRPGSGIIRESDGRQAFQVGLPGLAALLDARRDVVNIE